MLYIFFLSIPINTRRCGLVFSDCVIYLTTVRYLHPYACFHLDSLRILLFGWCWPHCFEYMNRHDLNRTVALHYNLYALYVFSLMIIILFDFYFACKYKLSNTTRKNLMILGRICKLALWYMAYEPIALRPFVINSQEIWWLEMTISFQASLMIIIWGASTVTSIW